MRNIKRFVCAFRGRCGSCNSSISPIFNGVRPMSTYRSGLLTDSYPMTWNLSKSSGSYLVHHQSGDKYLDFNCGFGSLPLGWNHPELTDAMKKETENEGLSHFVNKPSNSDFYTDKYFAFIDKFKSKVVPKEYDYQFFGGDGAWAVTQAIKVAHDWKLRKYPHLESATVMYFEQAFHGRDGYSLSLTNTDPIKTINFPKFNDWVRIPLDVNHENESLTYIMSQLIAHTNQNGVNDISAMIIEPIQCEGGDRHLSKAFLESLQDICQKHDILLCLDEVQTGFYTTGKPWCFEHFDLEPDIVSFSKKTQQGGIFANSRRLDEVEDHCFKLSSRINSTWGGNLVDMIRCSHIIDIVHKDNLQQNAKQMGDRWKNIMNQVDWELIAPKNAVTNIRGRGLIMSFDYENGPTRDRLLDVMRKKHNMLALGCGEKTVRFRPTLSVSSDEIDDCVERTIKSVAELQ